MKTEKSKEIFWSIISILVGGVAWLTMQNISWGVVDPGESRSRIRSNRPHFAYLGSLQ